LLEIEVLEVERREDGSVVRAEIITYPFQITFSEKNGKVRASHVIRLDSVREGPEYLFVPPGEFKEASRIAWGIFHKK